MGKRTPKLRSESLGPIKKSLSILTLLCLVDLYEGACFLTFFNWTHHLRVIFNGQTSYGPKIRLCCSALLVYGESVLCNFSIGRMEYLQWSNGSKMKGRQALVKENGSIYGYLVELGRLIGGLLSIFFRNDATFVRYIQFANRLRNKSRGADGNIKKNGFFVLSP